MRDLLRFIACGSVDDGKSTLIGHILYDSKLLYADQERALELESRVGSRGGKIDYSLLLDGLTEEREQGITIDVAYRYFTTDARSFIVADTPGHEEYTRNMAVGASNADLAVILTDAAKGVVAQTKRHARICSVMGIRHFIFAVNKMDLVHYEEGPFRMIEADIRELAKELGLQEMTIIPVSATEGDNVTRLSANMSWYKGVTLLSCLENVEITEQEKETGFYMPVQRVSRPDHRFRGFQGQIESGEIRIGDEITALPGREKAHIRKILVGDQERTAAYTGQAVTLQLDREIDVSRGSVLERDSSLHVSASVTATLVWMDDRAMERGGSYFVKLGTSLLPGVITRILYKIDVNTGRKLETDTICKNEIGVCMLSFTDQIAVDRFRDHRSLGELILIDRVTFMTSACGVVEQYGGEERPDEIRISEKTRSAAMGQRAVTILFDETEGITRFLLWEVERQLILEGRYAYFIDAPEQAKDRSFIRTVRHLNRAGIIVLVLRGNRAEKKQASETWDNVEVPHAIRYDGEGKDRDGIVSFVKKASSFEYDLSEGALYI
ncbi:MAG: GTP-binding protein [Lachnospiraceae bacterium]|nr:GTP-binding protein [Lachnospiraceae bacterium]